MGSRTPMNGRIWLCSECRRFRAIIINETSFGHPSSCHTKGYNIYKYNDDGVTFNLEKTEKVFL